MTRDEFIEAVKGYLKEEAEISKKYGVARDVSGYEFDDDLMTVGTKWGHEGHFEINTPYAQMEVWSEIRDYRRP